MKRFLRFVALLLAMVNITPIHANAVSEPKLVALTFDDGPHATYTAQLLDGLKERGVPVTFFMLGQCAEAEPDLVRRAYEEGHEIACHTWSHPDLQKLSDEIIRSQITRCCDLFDEILGVENEYLVRPPYGSTDKRVRAAVDEVMLFWSVDTLDWKLKDEEKVYQKILSEVHDGAIILCHDIHKTTIPAALRAVDTLRAQGYEFVTVSELFRRRGVEPVAGKLYSACAPGAVDPGPIPEPVIRFESAGDGSATVIIDSDVPVCYTTNGSYPDGASTSYSGPFTVEDGTEIKAAAVWRHNGSRSAVVSAQWVRPVSVSVPIHDHVPVPAPQNRRAIPAEQETTEWSWLAPVYLLMLAAAWADIHGKRMAKHRRRRRPKF